MLLEREAFFGLRYSHVVRMRSDAIFLTPWRPIAELSHAVPAGTVAGPLYSREKLFPNFTNPKPGEQETGNFDDKFWM